MELLKQNSNGLYIDIQKIGCFFRSALRMAEFIAEKKNRPFLTVKQINKLWECSQLMKFIDKDKNTVNSAGIANIALDFMNLKGKFVEVATFKDGVLNWYASVPHSQRRADFYIQKIKQSGPSKTHFRNVDKYGELLFDPHDPEIISQGVYYTICYRFDEVK